MFLCYYSGQFWRYINGNPELHRTLSERPNYPVVPAAEILCPHPPPLAAESHLKNGAV